MFKKILLPIDLQETHLAVKAVKIAIDEARKHSAEICVMTVMPGFGMPVVASFFPDNAMKKALTELGSELKRYIAANFPKDISTHPIIAEGNPGGKNSGPGQDPGCRPDRHPVPRTKPFAGLSRFLRRQSGRARHLFGHGDQGLSLKKYR